MTSDALHRDPAAEIRRHQLEKCATCGAGLMENGGITFMRVRLERFVFNVGAVRRLHELETSRCGGWVGAALAEVMGLDEPLARRLGEPIEGLICQACGLAPDGVLRTLERIEEQREGKSAPATIAGSEKPLT